MDTGRVACGDIMLGGSRSGAGRPEQVDRLAVLAQPGQRDALLALLLDSARESMPGVAGCRAYVVGVRPEDADAVWITEIWDSAEQHLASLQVPEIREVIARARPLIAGMGEPRVEIQLMGGHGLG